MPVSTSGKDLKDLRSVRKMICLRKKMSKQTSRREGKKSKSKKGNKRKEQID